MRGATLSSRGASLGALAVKDPIAEVDLVVRGASEIATPVGATARGGSRLSEIRIVERGAIAVDGGRIAAVGPESEIERAWRGRRTIDVRGGIVVPGFVDAHTHPVFAGTREDEFEMRTRGATYVEIAAQGGGILSSVRGVRACSRDDLLEKVLVRLDRFLELGTTTIEAKSGYGLCVADELKSLEVLARASELHPITIVPTFLGAHDYPAEFRENKRAYVDLLVDEMLPAVAERGLAEYCDVFAEKTAFDLDDSRRVLTAAAALGMRLRVHADQLTHLGGAELAAELGADSADHLEHVGRAGIEALLQAGVIPVLCPIVPLYLRVPEEAPARAMIDAGLAPAISTDFNPGSAYVQSMPEVLTWASLRYRMTAPEALTASTLNAACSLGRGAELGTIEVGKRADLACLDLPNHRHLVYELGRNPVVCVVKDGRVVVERPRSAAIRRA